MLYLSLRNKIGEKVKIGEKIYLEIEKVEKQSSILTFELIQPLSRFYKTSLKVIVYRQNHQVFFFKKIVFREGSDFLYC